MPANHIVTSCAGAADNLRKKEEFTLLARFKARSILTAGTVAQTVVRRSGMPGAPPVRTVVQNDTIMRAVLVLS